MTGAPGILAVLHHSIRSMKSLSSRWSSRKSSRALPLPHGMTKLSSLDPGRCLTGISGLLLQGWVFTECGFLENFPAMLLLLGLDGSSSVVTSIFEW